MPAQMKTFLSSYNLLDKVISYVKDEGGNLSILTKIISFMVKCALFAFDTSWQCIQFGHAFNKACQYACNDTKVDVGFQEINFKSTQVSLQKTITWTKNFDKGHIEQKKGVYRCKNQPLEFKILMRTKFASKVIIFQETLEY